MLSVEELAASLSLDSVDFHPLRHTIHTLQVSSIKHDGEKTTAEEDFKKKLKQLPKGPPAGNRVVRWILKFVNHMMGKKDPFEELHKAAKRVQKANARLMSFERGFIHDDGIKDREWYRHLGVAPGKWLGE